MFFDKNRGAGAELLVVGLGNPGEKYENTRHNVGFLTVDELAERARVPVQKLKHRALTNTLEVGGVKVLLMKPVTYMNLSGEAVGEAARFYKIPPERVLVISDDVSLPLGKLRIRKGGSAGGHNGLKSIIQPWVPTSSPGSRSGWARSPTPTTTWPTGCSPNSPGRISRPSQRPSVRPPTRWSASFRRGRTRP